MADQDSFCPYCGSKMLTLMKDSNGSFVKCFNCNSTGPKGGSNLDAVRLFRRRVGMSMSFVEAMREVIKLDQKAFEDLLCMESPCDELLLKDRWAQVVSTSDNEYSLRLLGFINGVLGRITGGLGIAVHKDEVKGIEVRVVDLVGLRDDRRYGIS